MVSLPNRFFRGVVKNSDKYKHPNFRFIIVDTVKDAQDDTGQWYVDSFDSPADFLLHNPDHGEVFYGVYGSYWIDKKNSLIKITETSNLNEAINIAEEIMGNKIIETTNDRND